MATWKLLAAIKKLVQVGIQEMLPYKYQWTNFNFHGPEIPNTKGNILMVVGGGDPAVDSAYALSLDPDVPVPSCLQTICDFPHRAHALVGAVFEDNLPTFCGGSTDWTSNTVHQECYKYNYTTNLWGDGTSGSVPSGSKHFAASHTGMHVKYNQMLKVR